MKRLVVAAFAAAALALVVAPVVNAAPAEKTTVCHVNSANDSVSVPMLGTFVFGMQIEVSNPAVPSHVAHGDDTGYLPMDGMIGQMVIRFLEKLGLALPNADCLFHV